MEPDGAGDNKKLIDVETILKYLPQDYTGEKDIALSLGRIRTRLSSHGSIGEILNPVILTALPRGFRFEGKLRGNPFENRKGVELSGSTREILSICGLNLKVTTESEGVKYKKMIKKIPFLYLISPEGTYDLEMSVVMEEEGERMPSYGYLKERYIETYEEEGNKNVVIEVSRYRDRESNENKSVVLNNREFKGDCVVKIKGNRLDDLVKFVNDNLC